MAQEEQQPKKKKKKNKGRSAKTRQKWVREYARYTATDFGNVPQKFRDRDFSEFVGEPTGIQWSDDLQAECQVIEPRGGQKKSSFER